MQLCESFCVSLFRSCGDVEKIGSTKTGKNSSLAFKAFLANNEIEAATAFCVDQFQDFPDTTAVVVADNAVAPGRCYGQHTDAVFDLCDPYQDQRFWHVVGASMQYSHGLTLLIICVLLIVAAFCVGWNMMLVRRKTNWMIKRQLQERAEERYPRGEVGEEDSLLVSDKFGMN